MRTLGIPTVADRIAQTVVAKHLEERVERIFHPDSYGYRPRARAKSSNRRLTCSDAGVERLRSDVESGPLRRQADRHVALTCAGGQC